MFRYTLLFLFGILFASCGAKKNPAFATRNFETNTSTENIAPFFESENAIFGSALVDVYEVTYEGLKEPILLYISFYDYETLLIPKGFTKRNP